MKHFKCLHCYKPVPGSERYHQQCARGFYGTSKAPIFPYDLDHITHLAKKVVRQRVTVPGVQAKLSVRLPNKGENQSRLTLVGVMGNYILKPPVESYPHMPQIEDCTMHLATLFGVRVVPHALIPLQSGELAYITKRIDRLSDGTKIAMEDMCQLSGKLTEHKYMGSMEQIGKLIRLHSTNPGFDLVRFFHLTLFCFVTGNGDMHLKNFSLWTHADGTIGVTPAYDLISTRLLISEHDDSEEMALSLSGKKSRLKLQDFQRFGESLHLTTKQTENVLRRSLATIPKALALIDDSFLPQSLKSEYQALLTARAERLR